MSTNTSIEAGLAASNVAFQVGYENAFDPTKTMPGAFTAYCDVTTGIDAEVTQLEMLANHPQMREWIGMRREQYFREYSQQLTLKTYEATLPIPRKTLQYRNRLGIVTKGIADWLNQEQSAFDRTAYQKYMSASGAGPTGYDGVALFSTAHPHSGTGSNQANLAAATDLSAPTLDAGITAMESLVLENGEMAGYSPNILLVGPALKRRARQLVGFNTRIMVVDAAGKTDATASGVAASTVPNVFDGEMTIVVDMRRVGAAKFYWDLIDTSRPGVRPMIKLVGQPPTPGHRDQPNDPVVFEHDKVKYGLVGDWVDDAGMWMCCYRGTGTA